MLSHRIEVASSAKKTSTIPNLRLWWKTRAWRTRFTTFIESASSAWYAQYP